MISFSQLTESMNSSYPYKLERFNNYGDDMEYEYHFDAKKVSFSVSIAVDKYNGRNQLNVIFMDDQSEENISGRVGSDSIKVFSTVGKIVEEVYNKHPGFSISFSAANGEQSRVRLYYTLASKIAKKVGGQMIVTNHTHYVIYKIMQRKPMSWANK